MRGALEALAPFHLPQHADQYRSEHPILLAVDEKLGEGRDLTQISRPSSPVPLDRSTGGLARERAGALVASSPEDLGDLHEADVLWAHIHLSISIGVQGRASTPRHAWAAGTRT
jgi:hypothetical protein